VYLQSIKVFMTDKYDLIFEELVEYEVIEPEVLLENPDLETHISDRDVKGKVGNKLIGLLEQSKPFSALFKKLGQSRVYSLSDDLDLLKMKTAEQRKGKGFWKRISEKFGKTSSAVRNRWQRLTGRRK